MNELFPCPFCGNDQPYFERLGDHRQSSIVVCGNCGCRMEANETDIHNGDAWNRRMLLSESCELLHSCLEWDNGGERDYQKIIDFLNRIKTD